METTQLIILLVAGGAALFLWLLTWFYSRGCRAYDLATGKYVRIRKWFFYDPYGNIRNVRSYDAYIADVRIEGLCEVGDVLLCESREVEPGSWCIWWDLIIGPHVYRLTEEDCIERTYAELNLPIVTYIIST